MRFQAAIFDAGDILFDATDWRRWLFECLKTAGKAASYSELFDPWDERYLPQAHLGKAGWDDLFRDYMLERGLTAEEFAELLAHSERKKKELYAKREAFPGVRETLRRLKEAGVRTAVLTDSESPAPRAMKSLEALGIGEYFDALVSSVDIGVCKPSPVAFDAALAALDTKKENAVFIAHDPDEILGARDHGLAVIAFNSHDPRGATWVVELFTEIADLILETSKPHR